MQLNINITPLFTKVMFGRESMCYKSFEVKAHTGHAMAHYTLTHLEFKMGQNKDKDPYFFYVYPT